MSIITNKNTSLTWNKKTLSEKKHKNNCLKMYKTEYKLMVK